MVKSNEDVAEPRLSVSFSKSPVEVNRTYTPSITFHCFTLSSKPTSLDNLIIHLSLFLSVGLISWL